MTSYWAHWRGRVEREGVDTADGARMLVLEDRTVYLRDGRIRIESHVPTRVRVALAGKGEG